MQICSSIFHGLQRSDLKKIIRPNIFFEWGKEETCLMGQGRPRAGATT